MRTAEEIYNSIIKNNRKGMSPMEAAMKCIRVAREDVVIECAKRAKSEWIRYGTKMGHEVDKKSILSLINELK